MGMHWYDVDGMEHHEAPIQEARDKNYLYSVSAVTGLWPKFALDKWKINEAIRHSRGNPPLGGCLLWQHQKDVRGLMEKELDEAAAKGNIIHDLATHYSIWGKFPDDINPNYQPHAMLFKDWFDRFIKKTILSEDVLIHHEMGYAGRVDLVADTRDYGVAVIDYKSRDVGEKKIGWYDTQHHQLVGYEHALASCKPDLPKVDNLISVVINREEARIPYVKVWNPKFAERGWGDFQACYELLCRIHRHKPQIQKELPLCQAAL